MEEQPVLIDEKPTFSPSLTKDWSQLAHEVYAWAKYNWPDEDLKHFPHLGIGEEIGELTHAILKSAQGIRDKSKDDALDAIADAIIFASHYLGKFFPGRQVEINTGLPTNLYINHRQQCGRLLTVAGNIIQAHETGNYEIAYAFVVALYQELHTMAFLLGVDLNALTNQVWAEVQRRDWKKFPKNGFTE